MKQTVDFLNECEALSAALESLGGNELARLTTISQRQRPRQ